MGHYVPTVGDRIVERQRFAQDRVIVAIHGDRVVMRGVSGRRTEAHIDNVRKRYTLASSVQA